MTFRAATTDVSGGSPAAFTDLTVSNNLNVGGVAAVTGNISGGNISTGGVLVSTGNITGGNISTVGIVVATGNVAGGNITTAGVISATGNLAAGNISTAGALAGQSGTTATTFTWNGSGGTSGSITVRYSKVGEFIYLYLPSTLATTGTSSTILQSNTAIAAGFRPASNQRAACNIIQNNAASVSSPGLVQLTSAGILQIFLSNATGAFSNAATAGTDANASFVFSSQ